jgi:thioredoxin-like negative regulator of GroEL
MVLNNLAYVLAKQNKSGAVGLAEKANQLLPGRPALMDTWALALASERQVAKAVDVQRKAVEQGAQQQPELRLHLAELYLQAGDRSGARQELQTLAALGTQFTGHRQVNELLRSI